MDIDFASLLFSFQGRINRAKYWIAVVVYGSLLIAIFGLGFFFQFSACGFLLSSMRVLLPFQLRQGSGQRI